jgi:DNA replication protein DnaC
MSASFTQAHETTEGPAICEKHGAYIATISTLVINGLRATPHTSSCPVCLEEWQAERKREDEERAEKGRRYQIAVNRKAATIPSRFAGCTFENYVASNEGQKRALSFAKAFAENFAAVEEAGSSLALYGKPGTGKTHLASAVANHVLDAGRTVIYRQTIELVRAIRDTWRRGSDESETSVIEKYRSVGLLILDEVGVSFGSDAEKTQIFDVLDGRYREMRPTLIVSNLSLKGLQECLGERIYDRLMQNGSGCVVFDWGSYRPGAALATFKRNPSEDGVSPLKPNEQQSVAARMRKLHAEAEANKERERLQAGASQ